MIVGFTGTRDGLTVLQKKALLNQLNSMDIEQALHGDCIGADYDFHRLVASNIEYATISIYPPVNPTHRANCHLIDLTTNVCVQVLKEGEYIARNHNIVDDCDMLIACPKDGVEVMRSGTWATIRYAKKMKKAVCIIYSDGSIENK